MIPPPPPPRVLDLIPVAVVLGSFIELEDCGLYDLGEEEEEVDFLARLVGSSSPDRGGVGGCCAD